MTTPQAQSTAGSLISGFGLAAALLLGAVWTGMAVVDGNVVATALRFLVAMGTGLFYLVLFRAARRGPA